MKCHKFQFQSIQYRSNKFRVDFVGIETKKWNAELACNIYKTKRSVYILYNKKIK